MVILMMVMVMIIMNRMIMTNMMITVTSYEAAGAGVSVAQPNTTAVVNPCPARGPDNMGDTLPSR